jgi:hypothetical protein
VGILALDPNSLEGLELVGKIPPLTRVSLQAQGITRLQDLQGLSLIDLLQMPNLGRREAMTTHGHAEGKGAAWAVRVRLRAGGLLELRSVFEVRRGTVAQSETNSGFITDAGRALL